MSTNVQGHEKNPNCSGCIQQHSIVWSTGATTQTLQEKSNGIRGSIMEFSEHRRKRWAFRAGKENVYRFVP